MYRRWMTQFKESVLLSERNADFGKSYEVLIRGVADLLIVHAFSYKCLTPISDSKLMSYHYTITHYQQKQVNLWRELDLVHSMYEFLHHKVWRARKITYSFGLSGKWWLYLEGSPLQLSCFPYYLVSYRYEGTQVGNRSQHNCIDTTNAHRWVPSIIL
jgi:hypothetical protein